MLDAPRPVTGTASVEAVLTQYGPSLSSFVADRLVNDHGISRAAARKRIQRAMPPVQRLARIVFPHDDRFLFLREQRRSAVFKGRLEDAFHQSRSVYGIALYALEARGGVIPTAHFHGVSGSPYRLRGHVGSETILSNLLSLGFVKKLPDPSAGEIVFLPDTRNPQQAMRARLTAENILLDGIRELLRNIALVSYDKMRIRTDLEQPDFGHFRWDITAPSYAHPFVSYDRGRPNPGFFVADVQFAGECSEEHVQGFINKNRVLRALTHVRPFASMLVSERFSQNALHVCKKAGLLPATPRALFGRDVAAGLRILLETLNHAAAVVAKNPEKIAEIFSKLAKSEGAAGNLRGALFPLIVGHCVKKLEPGYLELGVAIPNTDIDVLLTNKDVSGLAIECKGKLSTSIDSESDIEHWLNHVIPHTRQWMRGHDGLRSARLRFEYWTTGRFAPEALALLEKNRNEIKRFDIDWKDGEAVRRCVAGVKAQFLTDVLRDHFTKTPIATF